MSDNANMEPDIINQPFFRNNNFIIVLLVSFIILSFLGINLLNITGNIMQTIIDIFSPLIAQILSVFGYTAGSVINTSADIVADTTKSGIDIAEGTVQSVGDLLKNMSSPNVDEKAKAKLDNLGNQLTKDVKKDTFMGGYRETFKNDDSANTIQNPISATKAQWCLVGEFQNQKGCVEVDKQSQCLSGQVFPDQKMCLNPTLSQNKLA